SDTITIAVQVNGKLRGEFQAATGVNEADAVATAKTQERVKPHIEGKEIVKAIYVPGKLVNLVVR
ncbi:MAG TPA: hypothetical protein VFH39_05195, partial [Candidatus Saccharimonadales bacterium]|nr:hypothetical protein [Candidatus Saccharimonadales bacterium]